MPRGKKKSKHPRKNANRAMHSSTITRYRGPLRIPGSIAQETIFTMNFSYTTLITANLSGVIDFVIGSSLVRSLPNWSNLQASFHEYRVLSFEMDFKPQVTYTSSYPSLALVVDRASSATLGSYAVAAQHESCTLVSSRYPFRKRISINGIEESVFTATTTNFDFGYIKGYGDNFATSQNLGRYFITFLVQFRGVA